MSTAISYKQNEPGGPYDAILIGSGVGSLTTAAALAREGKRCLILERHYAPGGFTHVFKRRNYEWDVGVHYIGEVHRETSFLAHLFRFVTNGELKWAEIGEVYDRIRFGDETFNFMTGIGAFKDSLKASFPDARDCASIDAYVEFVRAAAREARRFFAEKTLPGLQAAVAGPFMRRGFLKYASRSTLDVMREITSNPRLIAVLTGQYGDYGLPPSKSSFAMHAMLVRHYFNGGAYPVGGSVRFFETMAPPIIEAGGCIMTNAEVDEIVVKGGRVQGVRMADGRLIPCKTVISGAGIVTTAHRLLDAEVLNKVGFEKDIRKVDFSAAHLCLYLGFPHSNDELELEPANWWYYPPVYDHDQLWDAYSQDPKADFPVIYASFPSAKDPDWSNRYPGRSTVEVITLANYEWFAPWQETRWKKRGADYDAFKQDFTDRMLAKLHELEPQLVDKADHVELSSPLSTRHFCNYEQGEIYGLDHTPQRFAQRSLRPRTAVKGLYMTGQDVATAGIGGAMMGGLLCAVAVLGRNIIPDVMNA